MGWDQIGALEGSFLKCLTSILLRDIRYTTAQNSIVSSIVCLLHSHSSAVEYCGRRSCVPPLLPELLFKVSLKSGAGQNIVTHASPSARNSAFLISPFPVHSTSFLSVFFQYKVTRGSEFHF